MNWAAVEVSTAHVLANPSGLWTLVIDFVAGPGWLKIEAPTGLWSYSESASSECGADGDSDSLLARARCIFPDAPVGALIGKLGGSTAGTGSDGKVFVVGKSCVVKITDDGAPLYLTINDEISGMGNNTGTISVKIFQGDPVNGAESSHASG